MPEIERKWRANNLKLLELIRDLPCQRLTQGYLITWPGELRVRTDGTTCWLAAKSDGELVRDEWESEIPTWMFDQLFATTAHQVEKRRYRLDSNNQTWEVDVYDGRLTGLIIIEAECTTEAQAIGLQLPTEFGSCMDVTHDLRYKNKALAVDGLPD